MDDYFKGRGAQIKPGNKFLKAQYVTDHTEGLDEPLLESPLTQIFHEHPKKIVNKVDSPDLSMPYSMNPYQGCEHGCVYCYARNTHEYYGFSAGLDFETKIIVKENAAELLEKHLLQSNWKPAPIMLSGNTDCYQPQEKKFELTRKMLQVLAKYRHHHGDHYDFDGFVIDPAAVQDHVPIWVGGRTQRSLRRAVTLADGWNPFAVRPAQAKEWLAKVDVPAGFDVVLPTVKRVDPIDEPDQTEEILAATAGCGATITYATFRHESVQDYLDKLEALALVHTAMGDGEGGPT